MARFPFPVQIDTQLGTLYNGIYAVRTDIKSQRRYLKDMEQGIARKAAGNTSYLCYTQEQADEIVTKIDALEAKEADLLDQTLPLEAQYTGWSRFFLVKNNGGHIHSSMDCSTCNRNGSLTEFGWLPELSGLSEVEAVAAHGAILCTVCFPSAPVEWTDGRKASDATKCPGSLSYDYDRSTARLGYYSGNHATCSHCQKVVTVTKSNALRTHQI